MGHNVQGTFLLNDPANFGEAVQAAWALKVKVCPSSEESQRSIDFIVDSDDEEKLRAALIVFNKAPEAAVVEPNVIPPAPGSVAPVV